LTRVEKLLAELNDKLAGGPSEVVILPETELEYTSDGYILPVPLENAPTGGGNYKIVWDGVEYISPALDVTETLGEGDLSLAFGDSTILMGEEGAAAVGNPLPGAPFFMMLFPNGTAFEEGGPTFYGVFKATAEPTNPILSIVQVGAASGGGSASAGGGLFVVNAHVEWPAEPDAESGMYMGNATMDKTADEVLAALDANSIVQCKMTQNDTPEGSYFTLPAIQVFPGEKIISFSLYANGETIILQMMDTTVMAVRMA
jgi:hypothetical protein